MFTTWVQRGCVLELLQTHGPNSAQSSRRRGLKKKTHKHLRSASLAVCCALTWPSLPVPPPCWAPRALLRSRGWRQGLPVWDRAATCCPQPQPHNEALVSSGQRAVPPSPPQAQSPVVWGGCSGWAAGMQPDWSHPSWTTVFLPLPSNSLVPTVSWWSAYLRGFQQPETKGWVTHHSFTLALKFCLLGAWQGTSSR